MIATMNFSLQPLQAELNGKVLQLHVAIDVQSMYILLFNDTSQGRESCIVY